VPAKGAALGAMLAIMMSVIALSLPEMIILKQMSALRLISTPGIAVGGTPDANTLAEWSGV